MLTKGEDKKNSNYADNIIALSRNRFVLECTKFCFPKNLVRITKSIFRFEISRFLLIFFLLIISMLPF